MQLISKNGDTSKLLNALDSVFKPRGCRGEAKSEPNERLSNMSPSKRLAIRKELDREAKTAAQI